jgi:hypothetical protein
MSEVVQRPKAAACCPNCGTALTPDLPEWLCPRCLLNPDPTPAAANEPDGGPDAAGDDSGTAPGRRSLRQRGG